MLFSSFPEIKMNPDPFKIQQTIFLWQLLERISEIHQSRDDAAAASLMWHLESQATNLSYSDRWAHCVQIAVSPLDSTQLFFQSQQFLVKNQVVWSRSQHFPVLFYLGSVKQRHSSPAQKIPNLSPLDLSSNCKRALINNLALDPCCSGKTNPTDLIIRHFIVS